MRFCLHFTNVDVTDEMADQLYGLSGGDATLYQRDLAAYADFERDAPTMVDAVRSAIADAEKAGFKVERVSPHSEEQGSLDEVNASLAGRS
jgi:hypothetical protein